MTVVHPIVQSRAIQNKNSLYSQQYNLAFYLYKRLSEIINPNRA